MGRIVKVKILIYMVREGGGVGRVISEIKPLLEREGHIVKVISRENDLNGFCFYKGIFKIGEIARKEKYDIIFSQDWSCALAFLFFRNHYCFYHGKTKGVQFLCQFFVSKFLKNRLIVGDIVNSYLFDSYLNPNGVNVTKFKPLNQKREYLGWINKGTEMITPNQIENLGKKVNLPVLIAKDIPPEKMNELFYNKCKIFISLPPKIVGCQLSYMEAMAAGVPKIVGNNHGEGFKYPFEKVENFPNTESALKNAKKRDYRKFIVENNITWRNFVKNILKIFNKSI